MKRIKQWTSILLTAVLLLSLTAPAALAADSTVTVRTVDDLVELSRKCTLDTWSQGKTVILDADLDLSGADFSPIPTFGGTFQGKGHRISGLSITGSGNDRGLFRYVQKNAVVQDLTVEGSIRPDGHQDELGLIAGKNSGRILNCTANGTVSGDNRIGGIVGVNAAGGELVACNFAGSVTGKHSVGGVAGENEGTLTLCRNNGSINTRDLEDAPKTDYTNLARLNSMDNVPAYTDIGGVAGLSGGTVQSCRNEGIVGSEQIGYNVGGIAGRQSGWLDGCVNTGSVYGRKDVGGIVGQLEPQVIQNFSEDFLDRLLDELDGLQDLMDRTANDGEKISDQVSRQLVELSERARQTKEIAGELTDAMTDWANGNIDQINELSARVSWALDQLSPIMDKAVKTMDLLDDLLDDLEKVRDDLKRAAENGDDAAESFQKALEELQKANSALNQAVPKITAAMNELLDLVINGGSADEITQAMKNLTDALDGLSGVMEQVDRAIEQMKAALKDLGDAGTELKNALEDMDDVHDGAEDVLEGLDKITKNLRDMVKELSEKPDITIHPIGDDITEKGDQLQDAMDALMDSGDALNQLLSDSSDTLIGDLKAINRQFKSIINLIRSEKSDWDKDGDKTLNERIKDRFQDVSDSCTEANQHSGRLSANQNQGAIQGDTAVGGIAGSVGVETDFDLDEDVNQVGNYSLNYRYQAKALISSCVNYGPVSGKQDYVGGVVGRAYLGLVTACQGYGAADSDGSYVGGIAGSSEGTIRSSWAKCSLSGTDYVGGVAGYGENLDTCRTLVTVSGEAYVGAIAGGVDENGTVKENVFTHDTLGGLDGISYAGKAEPVPFEALCALPGVPETFSQLELTFVADGKLVAVVPFQYGKGIESLPEIPAKKGCSAAWPALDYRHLTASQTLEAVYAPYSSALSDGGELPRILVDGSFSAGAAIEQTTEEAVWTDKKGREWSGTAYTVTVDDPDLKEISYTVHYRLPDSGKRYDLWVRTEDGWQRQDSTVDGSYLLFPSTREQITFCVVERPANTALFMGIGAAGCGVVLVGAVAAIRKKLGAPLRVRLRRKLKNKK